MRSRSARLSTRLVATLLLCALITAPSTARAAELDITDLMINYESQTATSAQGYVEFNLRFACFNNGPTMFDLFSAQVSLAKALPGAAAAFALDEFTTEDTAAIGPDYWLPNAPTGNEVASTQGPQEFRFRDLTSPSSPVMPEQDDIVAHFVIDFDIASGNQFGDYQIVSGSPASNFFSLGPLIFNVEFNTIAPTAFTLLPIPEPASGLLCLAAGALLLTRRPRRRIS